MAGRDDGPEAGQPATAGEDLADRDLLPQGSDAAKPAARARAADQRVRSAGGRQGQAAGLRQRLLRLPHQLQRALRGRGRSVPRIQQRLRSRRLPMGAFLDRVPFSGIIRIRDMMYAVREPFRLDQGDVSFDAPDSVKAAMHRAIDANHSHYLQTTGVPRLLDLLAGKLRNVNHIPVESPDEIMVTTGGIHALYLVCQALLEPGDEVVIPDPTVPPSAGNIIAAQAKPVGCPLHEDLGWRFDLDDLEQRITSATCAIYINSPHNPTGGVLTREDLARLAAIATERKLWIISDEAYEDVLF